MRVQGRSEEKKRNTSSGCCRFLESGKKKTKKQAKMVTVAKNSEWCMGHTRKGEVTPGISNSASGACCRVGVNDEGGASPTSPH